MLEAQLERVGIRSAEEPRRGGSQEAWLRILAIVDSACINRLMALEGAARGVRWHSLLPETKAEPKDYCQKHKG